MIDFLIDGSALWRLQRESEVQRRWRPAVHAGQVGTCAVQRIEFMRSARSRAEYDQFTSMFLAFPDVPHPKTTWRWIESAQHRLVAEAAIRALSPVDLVICATAAQHGLVVLHDDADFETAARILPDVRAHRIAPGR